jgi:hypothetical protein
MPSQRLFIKAIISVPELHSINLWTQANYESPIKHKCEYIYNSGSDIATAFRIYFEFSNDYDALLFRLRWAEFIV